MQCKVCNVAHAQYELINDTCLKCSANALKTVREQIDAQSAHLKVCLQAIGLVRDLVESKATDPMAIANDVSIHLLRQSGCLRDNEVQFILLARSCGLQFKQFTIEQIVESAVNRISKYRALYE